MFITYKELFELSEFENAQIVAGKNGLDRNIHWCHVFEMEDSKNWSNPNLLVLTTGIAIQNSIETHLLAMVENLNSQRSAGLVIGMGEYIEEVPSQVIDRANTLKFPIITLPSDVRFADINYKIANMIFDKQATMNRQQMLLESIITDADSDYGAELEYYGYIRHIPYRFVVIRRDGKGRISEQSFDVINGCVTRLKDIIHRKIFIMARKNQIILLVPYIKDNEGIGNESILSTILLNVNKLSTENRYIVGVSNWSTDPAELFNLYNETQVALNRGRYIFPDKQVINYTELGIFALVDFSNEAVAHTIVTNTLGEVAKDSELLESLHTYINCGSSMQAAADELYIHVNTMKYRMKKIDVLLPKGISRNDVFLLESAIFLQKYLLLSESDKNVM